MIRVSVIYNNSEGSHFDHDYYQKNHKQLIQEKLTPLGLIQLEIDKGIAGGTGGPPPYVAVAHMFFDSLEAFQMAARSPGMKDIVADIKNYTDIRAFTQISQVID